MGERVARKRQASALVVDEEMRGLCVLGGRVVRRERLGGLLSFYHRRAAA